MQLLNTFCMPKNKRNGRDSYSPSSCEGWCSITTGWGTKELDSSSLSLDSCSETSAADLFCLIVVFSGLGKKNLFGLRRLLPRSTSKSDEDSIAIVCSSLPAVSSALLNYSAIKNYNMNDPIRKNVIDQPRWLCTLVSHFTLRIFYIPSLFSTLTNASRNHCNYIEQLPDWYRIRTSYFGQDFWGTELALLRSAPCFVLFDDGKKQNFLDSSSQVEGTVATFPSIRNSTTQKLFNFVFISTTNRNTTHSLYFKNTLCFVSDLWPLKIINSNQLKPHDRRLYSTKAQLMNDSEYGMVSMLHDSACLHIPLCRCGAWRLQALPCSLFPYPLKRTVAQHLPIVSFWRMPNLARFFLASWNALWPNISPTSVSDKTPT